MTTLKVLRYVCILLAILFLPFLIFFLPLSVQFFLLSDALNKLIKRETPVRFTAFNKFLLLSFTLGIGILNIFIAYSLDNGFNSYEIGDPLSLSMLSLYSVIALTSVGALVAYGKWLKK